MTLRKGAENMTLGFGLSDDLVITSIDLSRIGSYILFDDSVTDLSFPSGNAFSYDLGKIFYYIIISVISI